MIRHMEGRTAPTWFAVFIAMNVHRTSRKPSSTLHIATQQSEKEKFVDLFHELASK